VKRCKVRLQGNDRESGAVALGMAMSSFGVIIAQGELNEECGIARDGSRLANLVGAARAHRFSVETLEGLSAGDLPARRLPAVIGWRAPDRYATCVGRSGSRWIVNDPAEGRVELEAADFAAAFTGVALLLSPGPGFVREGREPSFVRSLMPIMACCRLELLLAFVVGLLLIPVNLVEPNLNRFLMDHFLVDGYLNWGPPLFSLGLLILLLTALGNYLWGRTKVSMNLRIAVVNAWELMRTMFTLPPAFFQTRLAGELAGRVEAVMEIAYFMSARIAENALGFLSLVCFGALLVSYDAVLGSFAVLLAAIVFVVLVRRQEVCSLLSLSAQQQHARMIGIATHGISMIETLKASGMEDGFFAECAGLYGREQNASMALSENTNRLYFVQYVAQSVGMAAIVCFGALRILDGGLSCGAYVAFQLVLGCFLAPIAKIVDSFSQLQDVYAYANKVLDVVRHPAARHGEMAAAALPAEARKLDGLVELRDVTFGYNRNDPPLLEHFNLTVGVGERVAIVGLSGSGKSTVAKLVSGAYEPWSGEVLFDGRPRGAYSAEELRYSFAMVDQDVQMFPGTVLENLTMYDATVPFDSVRRAAEDAMVHAAIISRPGGYQAELNAQGTNFSGGERQRMEIARALAVDPSVLLLDEATAALDPSTEEKLDLNLRRRGVTTIVIAHRLSTIRDADRIVVLQRGRIVETGTHDELLKLNGVYAELARS